MIDPTEAQYLIINALEALDLLIEQRYDQDNGNWYIYTRSPVLPFAMILQDGEVSPIELELS